MQQRKSRARARAGGSGKATLLLVVLVGQPQEPLPALQPQVDPLAARPAAPGAGDGGGTLPVGRLDWGRLIFQWQTIAPPTATNAPPGTP